MSNENNGYENTAACILLATHCACCNRPLVDSVSVELGMGPICRRKHGHEMADKPASWDLVKKALATCELSELLVKHGEDQRKVANVVVHRIAALREGELVGHLVAILSLLGFIKLAGILAKRLDGVRVTREGETLVVETPYNEAFVGKVRALRCAPWDNVRKVNYVAAKNNKALWAALQSSFPKGTVVVGDNGVRVLS